MNRSTFAKFGLSVVSAGILCGAALGLAGAANAESTSDRTGPNVEIVATPEVTAPPLVEAYPGAWWHNHHPSLLEPAAAMQIPLP